MMPPPRCRSRAPIGQFRTRACALALAAQERSASRAGPRLSVRRLLAIIPELLHGVHGLSIFFSFLRRIQMLLIATLKTRVTRTARNTARRSSWNAARLIPGPCLPFTTFPAQIAETVRSLQVPTRLRFENFA